VRLSDLLPISGAGYGEAVAVRHWQREPSFAMATIRNRSHKKFQLDAVKIKRAQKVLGAKTETETIERALDLAISEQQRNRLVQAATDRFANSGIKIKDVYGRLDS
jgi:SOS response regulatory protein OraA/RecX